METVKEFFNGLFESTSERVKSVFLGTYSILFIVWNWQLFAFLLFSTKSIEDRLTTVNDDYMSWTVFVIPFAFTVLYVFLMPWVNLWVDNGLKKSNDELFRRKKGKRIQKLKQKAEEAVLEYDIASNKAGTNEIEQLRKEVESANESRDKARDLNSKLQRDYDILQNKLNEKENELNSFKSDFNNIINSSSDRKSSDRKWLDESLVSVAKVLNELTKDEQQNFIRIAKNINENGIVLNKGSIIDLSVFIKKNLIDLGVKHNREEFKVSPLGLEVYFQLTGRHLNQ